MALWNVNTTRAALERNAATNRDAMARQVREKDFLDEPQRVQKRMITDMVCAVIGATFILSFLIIMTVNAICHRSTYPTRTMYTERSR